MKILETALTNLPTMNFFNNVAKFLDNVTAQIQGIALSVIIFCIVCTGLMFIFGEGPSRTAKKWLTYIVVGSLVVFGAATLGQTIKQVGGF